MTDPNRHIVFAEPYDEWVVRRAREVARVTVLESCDEVSLLAAIRDCDALLVRTRATVSRELLDVAGRLRVIGRGGSGLDNIDVDAANERGIVVVHTPDAATDAVADLTVGLMIDMIRRITPCDRMVRQDDFPTVRRTHLGLELCRLTLGIVGMGRIGRAVARRCRHGFGMRIVYNDIIDPGPLDVAAEPMEKDHLYAEADVVSLHVPLTPETDHLISGAALARFKDGAYLINTARGRVVDGHAIARALENGKLAGAAFDVFEEEPLPPNHPLIAAPNTLFTAHIGAKTVAASARMNAVVDDVISVLEGKPPRHAAGSGG